VSTPALLDASPEALARALRDRASGRAWIVRGEDGRPRASHPWLAGLADFVAGDADADAHEAVFLAVAPTSGRLFGAFLHRLARGQAQGGLRHWPYPSAAAFLRDGLRLSRGMGRKNALAGLWWGGGKGLIARHPASHGEDPTARRVLFREYGDFVSSLRGCYVTAEDAGTGPEDVAAVFERTRFATCIPPALGGSGNPSAATAAGVVGGIEAALAEEGLGTLAGRRVAMQGLGNVGTRMVDALLERGVAGVVASELRQDRCRALRERWRGAPVELRHCAPEDRTILSEPADVLVPNALGGVLDPETIPAVRARVVCGAANNPLADEERDARALAGRGIAYVPDYVVNRMGIVTCANEQYGQLRPDPAVLRHLDPGFEHGIPAVTRRVLRRARERGIPTTTAAAELADALLEEPHPIWGERARSIVRTLVDDGWHEA
jgi:glutamate dehydrogenase/leucine dehydrogenase